MILKLWIPAFAGIQSLFLELIVNLSSLLLAASGIFYLAAFFLHLGSFSGAKMNRAAFAFLRVGFLVSTFFLAAEAIDRGFFLPVANLAQALAFFAWSLAFIYLVLLVKVQSESFGLILSPILTLLVFAAFFSKGIQDSRPLNPALLNPYFVVHIISAFFSYACFTLSFSAGLLYLIQHRQLKTRNAGTWYHKLPSLEELERLIYQPILWGAPLLIVTLAVGFIWSKASFGEFWIWDPKTLATAVTAILYLAIVTLRGTSFLRGRQAAVLSLIAFAFVIVSFVGVRFIASSHNL